MERKFQGVLKFKRFFGIKAGRSVWKESFIKTRVYADPSPVHSELYWLRDYVLPATGVRIVGYYVDTFFDMGDNLPL